MISTVVLVIEPLPVSDTLDDDILTDDSELQPKISGPQTIMTGEIPSQRLDSAYLGPFLQTVDEVVHPGSD
jgi:hypothetical protein